MFGWRRAPKQAVAGAVTPGTPNAANESAGDGARVGHSIDPERLLRRLEWTVLRRLDGLLQGDYRTLFRGAGLAVVWPQFLAMLGIGAVFFYFSLQRFRKFLR